jgi:hypothetical protein
MRRIAAGNMVAHILNSFFRNRTRLHDASANSHGIFRLVLRKRDLWHGHRKETCQYAESSTSHSTTPTLKFATVAKDVPRTPERWGWR